MLRVLGAASVDVGTNGDGGGAPAVLVMVVVGERGKNGDRGVIGRGGASAGVV